MRDQADQLRQLVRETVKENPVLEPGVPLIVLSGGKGGLGVSTVAIRLVQELAALGKQTVLVDAHPLQPDLATKLGIDARDCLADVLDGSRSAVEVLRPVSHSVRILPGRSAPDSPPQMNHDAIRRLLVELRTMNNHADLVVADAGNSMSPWVQQLWRAANQILLLTTPESVAVMDSYATAKLAPWGDFDGKLRLVVNQCDSQQHAHQIGERFAATCRRFLGIDLLPATAIADCPSLRNSDGIAMPNDNQPPLLQQSIRLLAAEIISNSLAVASRTVRNVVQPAVEGVRPTGKENLAEITNQTQSRTKDDDNNRQSDLLQTAVKLARLQEL